MRLFWLLVYLILIVLGVTFAFLNAGMAEINFYFKTVTLPISVLIVCTLGFGILIGFLLFLGRLWRLRMDNMRLKSQLKVTEKEVKNLRDIPFKD